MQFVILVLVGRLFGGRAAGDYAFLLAVLGPLFMLFDFGLRQLYLTRTPALLFTQALRLRIFTLIAIVPLCVLSAPLLQVGTLMAFSVALIKVCDSCIDLALAPLHLAGQLRRPALISMLSVPISVGGFLSMSGPVDVRLLGAGLWGSVPVAVFFVVAGLRADIILNRGAASFGLRAVLRDGFNISFAVALSSLASAIPQYSLATQNREAAGHYAVLLYVYVAIEMVFNARSQVALPILSFARRSGRLDFVKQSLSELRRAASLAFGLSVLACAGAFLAIPLFFGTEFRPSGSEIVVLFLAGALVGPLFAGSASVHAVSAYSRGAIATVTTFVFALSWGITLPMALGVSGALLSTALTTALRGVLFYRVWTERSHALV